MHINKVNYGNQTKTGQKKKKKKKMMCRIPTLKIVNLQGSCLLDSQCADGQSS